jgi:hypothetical protein
VNKTVLLSNIQFSKCELSEGGVVLRFLVQSNQWTFWINIKSNEQSYLILVFLVFRTTQTSDQKPKRTPTTFSGQCWLLIFFSLRNYKLQTFLNSNCTWIFTWTCWWFFIPPHFLHGYEIQDGFLFLVQSNQWTF